jgi:protein-tyrosine phosphatase
MDTSPFWIRNAPLGRLATSRRPPPDDQLRPQLAEWKRQGADIVVSLLGDDEMWMDGLTDEPRLCRELGLDFRHFPITDHGLPDSADAFLEFVEALHAEAERGRAIVVHCYAGIGRATLVAASLLVRGGLALAEALERISEARGVRVPDTPAQRLWLEHLEDHLRGRS